MDEKITEFYKQLQYLMAEHETEELTNAILIQEFISLSVINTCIFAVDTEQVDWTIRYVKKEALKLREEMEEAWKAHDISRESWELDGSVGLLRQI